MSIEATLQGIFLSQMEKLDLEHERLKKITDPYPSEDIKRNRQKYRVAFDSFEAFQTK